MSDMDIETVWEFYDPDQHRDQGGNYILLFKAFGNAPYYSGIAGNFADRFADHQELFDQGKRTFMRGPFIEDIDRSHHGFAARWQHYKQQRAEEQKKLVWVPANSANDAMGKEGAPFWNDGIAKLVSIRGKERASVEPRVQEDIKQYYNTLVGLKIDWRVTDYTNLMGDRPGLPVLTVPTLAYRLNGGQAEGPAAFFAALENTTGAT